MRNTIRRLLVLLAVLLLAAPLTAFADAARDYEKAQALLVKNKYAEAAEAFRKLGSYEDATILAMYSEACALAEEGDYDTAILVMKSMGDYKDCSFRVIYYTARAFEAAGGTDMWETMMEAQTVYRTIPLFMDSSERCTALDGRIAAAKQEQYDAAVTAGEAGDYAAARKAFLRLGSYRDCPSRIVYYAIRKDQDGLTGAADQDAAIAVARRYQEMGEYLDAQERAAAVTVQADGIAAEKYAAVDALIASASYEEAAVRLSGFGVYGNGQIPAKYYAMGQHALSTSSWTTAISAFGKAGAYEDAATCKVYAAIRRDEDKLAETTDQDALIALTERYAALGDFRDCAERITSLNARADAVVADRYAQVDALIAQGLYDDAEMALFLFGAYGSEQIPAKYYAMGVHALENGKWADASSAFRAAGSYADAEDRITYTALRKEEARLAGTTDQDALLALKTRYAALGDYLDCAARAAAMQTQADDVVAGKYMLIDSLTAQGMYAEAEKLLGSFGTYGSEQLNAKRYAIGVHALENGNYTKATSVFRALGSYSDSKDRVTYTAIRKDEAGLSSTSAPETVIAVAKRYTAMGDKFDCATRAAALTAKADAIVADKYAKIDALIAQGKYTEAEKLLKNFGVYGSEQINDKHYAIGLHALEAGNYAKAASVFKALGTYSDAAHRLSYTSIRKEETSLNSSSSADTVIAVAKRYTALGDRFDCAARAAALTAKADAIVADKYAEIDAAMAAGQCNVALGLLKIFPSYGSEQVPAKYYDVGVRALDIGDYESAVAAFKAAGRYADASDRAAYATLRKGEAALASSTDQDAVLIMANRYASTGDKYDCTARAAALRAKADAIVADKYAQVDVLISQGKYSEAEKLLGSFGTYGSDQVSAKRYAIGVHALENGNYAKATSVFKQLGSYSDSKDRVTYTAIRKDEAALSGSTDQDKVIAIANRYLKMGNVFDCTARAAALTTRADAIVTSKYAQVDALTAQGKYPEAEKILVSFGAYGNDQVSAKRYAIGVHALENGNYARATTVFKQLGSYSDSKDRVTYTAIRQDEAALSGSTDQDKIIAIAKRYTALGDKFDCAVRAAALTTRADAIVADKYAKIDQMTTQGQYTVAMTSLGKFGVYGNGQVNEKYYAIGLHATEAGEYTSATSAFKALGSYSDATWRGAYVAIRKDEAALADGGDQDRIIAVAQRYTDLGDRYDCAERAAALTTRADAVVADKCAQLDSLIALRRVSEAYELLSDFGSYGADKLAASSYALGQKALGVGHKAIALYAFRMAGDHADAAGQAKSLQKELNQVIAAGSAHTVGVRKDGTVVAVGSNSRGQCTVGSWTDVVAVAAGTSHTVGLRKDGTVVAVGYKAYRADATAVSKWTNITAIAAGSSHTVGLRKDGTVVAVGSNSEGQCNVSGWKNIVAIAAGESFTVGLRKDGTVVACGDNEFGQCDVKTWTGVVAIAAGRNHTIGLRADGTVLEIGDNGFAQCDVKDWTDIVAIAAGGDYTLGLRANGTVASTGWNEDKQLYANKWTGIVAIAAGENHAVGLKADGSIVTAGSTTSGQGSSASWMNITATAAGDSHTVGLRADGTVIAIGSNEYKQCNVSGWKDIVSIAAGERHTVGLRKDGTVVAVGYNKYSDSRCDVSGWKNITAIAAGEEHTVGLRSNGTVVATGINSQGRCNVTSWRDITAIAAGKYHTVGLRADGTVVAVGSNSQGQCNVTGWRNIVAIACGSEHTLGLRADGTVVAVGNNTSGQRAVSNWSGIVAIAAGGNHSVALSSSGTVLALGADNDGQCAVSSWKNIAFISAGYEITMGVRKDGTVVAVGSNYHCQCNTFIWNLFD